MKTASTFNAPRVIILGLLAMITLMLSTLLIAHPAIASNDEAEKGITIGLGDEASTDHPGLGSPPAGTPERQPARTGGTASGSHKLLCGQFYQWTGWYMPHPTDETANVLAEDCWRTGSSYFPIRNDAELDSLASRGSYQTGWVAKLECAPDGKIEGGGAVKFKREQNGRTLVGARVTYEYLDHTNLYWTTIPRERAGRLTNTPDLARNYNVDCIYQYWEDKSLNQICIVAIDIVFNKNRGVRDLGRVDSSRTLSSWGRGNSSLQACRKSNHLSDSLDVTLNQFGRYDGSTRVYYQKVVVRTYDGAPEGHTKPADEIISIGPLESRPGPNLYAQLTCDPDHTRFATTRSQAYTGGPWSWTWSDCDPTAPNTPGDHEAYRCTNANTATLNGTSGLKKATIFRDGEKNRLSWKNPSIGGSNLVSVTPRDTKVVRSGTPWNTPRSMPAGNNNVTLHTPGGTNILAKGNSWFPGRHAAFDFTANWASDAGKPTVIKPTWRFDATLNITGIRIDGITARFNANSGQWTINANTSRVNVPISSTATCSSEFTFDVVRAVNDAG